MELGVLHERVESGALELGLGALGEGANKLSIDYVVYMPRSHCTLGLGGRVGLGPHLRLRVGDSGSLCNSPK